MTKAPGGGRGVYANEVISWIRADWTTRENPTYMQRIVSPMPWSQTFMGTGLIRSYAIGTEHATVSYHCISLARGERAASCPARTLPLASATMQHQ